MKTDNLLHFLQQKKFMRSGGALPLPKHQAQISQVGHKAQSNIESYLGNPMAKAEAEDKIVGEKWYNPQTDAWEVEGRDNFRHPMAGRYTSEAITNMFPSWIPGRGILGFVGANALGLGHELIEPNRSEGYSWLDTIREGSEDLYNNMIGAGIGSLPLSDEQKTNALLYLSNNNLLPDGYANIKGRPTMYIKKQDGGSLPRHQWLNSQVLSQPGPTQAKANFINENDAVGRANQNVGNILNQIMSKKRNQPFVNFIDTRTNDAIVPGKKLEATRKHDVKGVSREELDKMVNQARKLKVDPSTLITTALWETNMGQTDRNLVHDLYQVSPTEEGLEGFDARANMAAQAINRQLKLGKKKYPQGPFYKQMQAFQGYGNLYPNTEEDYYGHANQAFFGIPVTKQNPLRTSVVFPYGKTIENFRDSVVIPTLNQYGIKYKKEGGLAKAALGNEGEDPLEQIKKWYAAHPDQKPKTNQTSILGNNLVGTKRKSDREIMQGVNDQAMLENQQKESKRIKSIATQYGVNPLDVKIQEDRYNDIRSRRAQDLQEGRPFKEVGQKVNGQYIPSDPELGFNIPDAAATGIADPLNWPAIALSSGFAAEGLGALGMAASPYTATMMNALEAPAVIAGRTVPWLTGNNIMTGYFAGKIPGNIQRGEYVDAALNSLPFTAPLLGAGVKGAKNLYNTVATGESILPIAWKSPAVGLSQEASQNMFKNITNSANLTDAERAIVADYQYNSRLYTGRNGNVDPIKKQTITDIIKKYNINVGDDAIATRMFNPENNSLGATLENGRLNFGDRPTSFTTGAKGRYGSGATDRIVIPNRYLKKMGDKFVKNTYEPLSEDALKLVSEDSRDWAAGIGRDNMRLGQERELIGSGLDFKKIGKVKNDVGGYDWIVKPNKSSMGAVPKSTANTVRQTSSYVVPDPVEFYPKGTNIKKLIEKSRKPKPSVDAEPLTGSLVLEKNPSRVENIDEYLGTRRDLKRVVDPKTNESISLKSWRDENGNIRYYFSSQMPNSSYNAGKSYYALDKFIPKNSTIVEPPRGSLSFDSFINTVKRTKNSKFKSSLLEGSEGIRLNDQSVKNKLPFSGDIGDGYYSSAEEAQKVADEINGFIKDYNLPKATVTQHPNDGSYQIMLPHISLEKLYKKGGELTSQKAAEMLYDGTANGKPLTAKQERYFKYIANKK